MKAALLHAGLVIVGLSALASACGEPDPVAPSQLLLHVETDAPVPRAGLGPDDLVLFDRLRISVYRAGDDAPCIGCTRDFVLSSEAGRDDLSVGIARQAGDAVAHVELYADRNLDVSGRPDVGSSISAWVQLPRPGAEETRPLYLTLTMATLGKPRGERGAPIRAAVSAPSPPTRWPEARTSACVGTPGPGEACVPGGVVWMGSAVQLPGDGRALHARLVRMSPFFVDLHEVTVGELRASGLAVTGVAGEGDPKTPPYEDCTFDTTAGARESFPVNCISHELAAAYCAARGKELPSEAQHEYLHGGLRGLSYPWGTDDPACGSVVYGLYKEGYGLCSDEPQSVAPIGSGPRDVLTVGGRDVVDLVGNVREWASDTFLPTTAECHRPGYFVDPVCVQPSTQGYATRGGSYADVPLGLRSERRFPSEEGAHPTVGFRCARRAP